MGVFENVTPSQNMCELTTRGGFINKPAFFV